MGADDVVILHQEFEKDRGITDLEITDNQKFYIIMEIKYKFADGTVSEVEVEDSIGRAITVSARFQQR